MERRQLEYFIAVVDHGSFTAAAGALYVAQPSLSQAIRSLERELGTELFHRLHRGVRLTPAGEALLAPARRAMRDLVTARAAVQEVVGLAGGRLDLSMLPALAMDPVASVVGAFRDRHPAITFAIRQPEERRRVVDDVRTGIAEIGILDSCDGLVDLEVVELSRQALLAVLPPDTDRDDSPMGWGELLDRGLIVGTVGTLVRDIVEDWARDQGREACPAVELGRRESGVYFVLAGAGVAAMPEPLARHAESLGAVLRQLADDHTRTIWMVHRPGPMSPAAGAFLRAVREAASATT